MSEKTDKSKLKKLKHVKVYDQLYEQIKNGTYPPEAQLPPETTLAASMNVSRMTLRKALLLLIEDGLIKNVPGVAGFPDRSAIRVHAGYPWTIYRCCRCRRPLVSACAANHHLFLKLHSHRSHCPASD